MSLTRFETADGVELVIDTKTREALTTQRGYREMSGRNDRYCNTISRWRQNRLAIGIISLCLISFLVFGVCACSNQETGRQQLTSNETELPDEELAAFLILQQQQQQLMYQTSQQQFTNQRFSYW